MKNYKLWKIISIDWVDAAGKTTLAKGISDKNIWVYYKTPGSVSVEEKKYFDSELITPQERYDFYFRELCKDMKKIQQYLIEWENVICDRFIESTVVHHTVLDPNVNLWDITQFQLYNKNVQILLIASRETILDRLSKRQNLTRFEKDIEWLQEVQALYKKRPFDIVLDTTKSSVQNTLDQTTFLLSNYLKNE